MKVYILLAEKSNLVFENEEVIEAFLDKFRGLPMSSDWEPVWIEEVSQNAPKYDMNELSCNPIFSEKAVSVLNHLLEGKAEVLPYQHKHDKYFAINVTNMIDCIDFSKADFSTYTGSDSVKEINKYVFIESLIADESIFKTPQHSMTRVFVTDQFRDKVLEAKLTGFKFREVWDSARSSEKEPVIEQIQYHGQSYPFKEAVELVMQGKTLASDKWLMQRENGELHIRTRELNGSFTWFEPIFIPPVLLDLQWYIVDKVNYPEK
ncbi:hypothetical protein SK3146_02894 [Paenibacillus konkukensis]|uniref:Immunity MXAN-0049 protein domain-containing protein n=1 Tax=Paenibacillus konkukensis TaxID=2020716 RepID=A0ABY4RNQ7_9BACL|nr:DUF1629 domain-containing protein [Paenibacillus konkukensis]UQZ83687.1 hypothetical protein SK3146_02894 [Paenibacillus konkukensis]